MKKIISVTLFACLALSAFAQLQYEVIKESDGNKILKGVISKELITSDPGFKWYNQNFKSYDASKEAAQRFAKHKDSIQLVVFLGTWCEDSHVIIPKLFPFLDAAGFPNDHLTVIGVDRNKKTISHLTEAFNVVNVPTVIVMKDGKELGRVVEYGRYGLVENDLADIVDNVK